VLPTDTSHSSANSPDVITINLSPSVSKLRNAVEMGVSRCKLPRPSESESGPGPEYYICFLSYLTFGFRAKIPCRPTDFPTYFKDFFPGPRCWGGGGGPPPPPPPLGPGPALSGRDILSHT
jgi:hypothetical protein